MNETMRNLQRKSWFPRIGQIVLNPPSEMRVRFLILLIVFLGLHSNAQSYNMTIYQPFNEEWVSNDFDLSVYASIEPTPPLDLKITFSMACSFGSSNYYLTGACSLEQMSNTDVPIDNTSAVCVLAHADLLTCFGTSANVTMYLSEGGVMLAEASVILRIINNGVSALYVACAALSAVCTMVLISLFIKFEVHADVCPLAMHYPTEGKQSGRLSFAP